jgi:hypothetical protein
MGATHGRFLKGLADESRWSDIASFAGLGRNLPLRLGGIKRERARGERKEERRDARCESSKFSDVFLLSNARK